MASIIGEIKKFGTELMKRKNVDDVNISVSMDDGITIKYDSEEICGEEKE